MASGDANKKGMDEPLISRLFDAILSLEALPLRMAIAIAAARDPEATDTGSGGVVRIGHNGIFFCWPKSGKSLRFSLPLKSPKEIEWTKIVGVKDIDGGVLVQMSELEPLFDWLFI